MNGFGLKPCPFCGSGDVELRPGIMFNGAVHCNSCTADVAFSAVELIVGKVERPWQEEIAESWNRRAGDE